MTKRLLATKDLTVNINGIEYDCLLIPKEILVDVDYHNCPEEHPRVKRLIEKIQKGEIK